MLRTPFVQKVKTNFKLLFFKKNTDTNVLHTFQKTLILEGLEVKTQYKKESFHLTVEWL